MRPGPALLLGGLALGCGEKETKETQATHAPGVVTSPLCSESASDMRLSFVFVTSACCGSPMQGQQLAFVPGAIYIAVADSCRFFVYDGFRGRVTTGTLTAESRAEWEALLPLRELDDAGDPRRCGFVAGSQRGRYAGNSFTLDGCGEVARKAGEAADRIVRETAQGRWGATRWDGPLMFLLIDDREGPEKWYANAPAWPLASDPAPFTMVGAPRTTGHVVLGDDAAKLRAVRERYHAGESGDPISGIVPVLGPDGRRYQLWSRDVSPAEAEVSSL